LATLWLDGRLIDDTHPMLATLGQPSGTGELSCYTTAKVTAGRALHPDYHARRLQRDAKSIGLDAFDPFLVFRAFEELGRAVFANAVGVVRIEALARVRSPGVSLLATSRPIGTERDSWSAITAPMTHPGPTLHAGAKLTGRKVFDEARTASNKAGVDEALLFDENKQLVEGARTNLLIVDRLGNLIVPDPALGAVAGIALEMITERVPELEIATPGPSVLADARELIAVNAVRGARSIILLDGRDIGDGSPGPWGRRLDALLSGPQ
jgi:branched-subunit amino acid aminotransferase/4-amino-4-deoxychorismate lyase